MTVVFKLGGSLLTLPDLSEKLRLAVNQRSDESCLIVVGGGASADLVREWSRVHELDDETAHWLAISSLDLNRRLIEAMLGWPTVADRVEAELQWSRHRSPQLLNLDQFLKNEESKSSEWLPHTWNVTSDSLTAWTAIRWPACELILLKSVPCPSRLTVQQASVHGFVDPWFGNLTTRIERVSWCNLREADIVIHPWL